LSAASWLRIGIDGSGSKASGWEMCCKLLRKLLFFLRPSILYHKYGIIINVMCVRCFIFRIRDDQIKEKFVACTIFPWISKRSWDLRFISMLKVFTLVVVISVVFDIYTIVNVGSAVGWMPLHDWVWAICSYLMGFCS
jgi:hypothetical protein